MLNNKIEKYLSALILASISFSDVTFNAFGSTESSPFPLLGILLFWMLKEIIPKTFFFAVIGLILLFFLGVLAGVPVFVGGVALFAYVQLIAVYLFYRKYGIATSVNLSRYFVCLHLLIGVLQFSSLIDGILGQVLSVLMPRASGAALTEIGRGVAFITTEPSHALQSIILPVYILAISTNRNDHVLAIITLILTLILSMAGLVMIYFIVFAGFILLLKPKYIPLASLSIIILFPFLPGRAGEVISRLYELLININQESLIVAFQFSGFRFPSVISPIQSLGDLPSVIGLGAWHLTILNSLASSGFDVSNLGHWKWTGELHPVKPYSVLANLAADMWWFGVVPFVFFIYKRVVEFHRINNSLVKSAIPSAIYGLSVFAILFLVTIGKPAFIAILGISAHYRFKSGSNKFGLSSI